MKRALRVIAIVCLILLTVAGFSQQAAPQFDQAHAERITGQLYIQTAMQSEYIVNLTQQVSDLKAENQTLKAELAKLQSTN